jgi:hypothetical protein
MGNESTGHSLVKQCMTQFTNLPVYQSTNMEVKRWKSRKKTPWVTLPPSR